MPACGRPVRVLLMRGCAFFWGLAAAAGWAGEGSSETPSAVDSTIVLRVGPLEVSSYALGKNLTRIRSRPPEPLAVAASSNENARFRLHLAQQVIIARALAEGFAERREVKSIVDTMERHMLSSPEGPLYRLLDDAEAISEEQLREIQARIGAVAGYENYVRRQRMALIQQKRRTRLLETSGFAFDRAAGQEIVARMRTLPLRTQAIPAELLSEIGALPMASYRVDGESCTVSFSMWSGYFNSLYLRRLPGNFPELQKSVEDLVVMELDCREAHQRGLDRTPRFAEDRRNFMHYQVLDLFERERLRPTIRISEAEIADRYREHSDDYAEPVRARGALLRFADEAGALAWMARGREAAAPVQTSAPGPLGMEELVVTAAQPLELMPGVTPAILMAPDGQAFGPAASPLGYFVFAKRTTERETLPLAAVAERIRSELTRSKLDAAELSLAREWSGRFAIEDRIPYAQLGFAGEEPSAPWAPGAQPQ